MSIVADTGVTMIGLFVQGRDALQIVEAIKRAESMAIPAVWMTMGGAGVDAPTVYAAASAVTERVKFGTSIIPTWPRHPIAIAQQAIALASLAPGRFRLGIGPSHQPAMERLMGVEWRTPLRQLREYLIVLKSLLHTGKVEFVGRHVTARAQIAAPVDIPVMASALRQASFETCGELADGAISWVCPWDYLRQVALPALAAGAAKAGRPAPPLIAHVPVCVHEDAAEVRQAAREQIGFYARVPFYAAMYGDAGFGDASDGLSDRLVDGLVVSGSAGAVVEKLRQILGEGAGEIIAHPILAGADRQASLTRVFEAVAAANRG
jgi:F420-dependent oxidoreductase-like protein